MSFFLKKENLFFVIISCLFILILLFAVSTEFYLTKYLFAINYLVSFFYLCFLSLIYSFPIIIYLFFGLINESRGIIKYFFYFFSSIYYILLIFLVLYFFRSKLVFDWHFFMCNIDEVITSTIGTIGIYGFFAIIVLFLFLSLSMIIFFESIKIPILKSKKLKFSRFIFLIIISCFCLAMGLNMGNKNPIIIKFFDRIFSTNSNYINSYNEKYDNVFKYYSNIVEDDFIFDESADEDVDIYFIHLESISGELVNEKITPELIKYSNEYGIRFTNFFSNTINTLRAEESILCAMPPSLNRYLNNTYNVEKMMCLPKIFENIGYKTMFFKSHDLKYTKTGDFMRKIGFSEVYNGDIMKEGDTELTWGYREDIFYERVMDHLNKDDSKKKFIYIAVSSTNHYPFDTNHFNGDLPFTIEEKTTKHNLVKKLSNSVYVQDSYFGTLMERLVKDEKKKYIFIYSDNAWPVGIHKDNIFNEAMAYKENFLIPMTFISVGGDNFKKSEIVEDYYSQIDMFNTILDLYNINLKKDYLGESFYEQLEDNEDFKNDDFNKCILNIQPFSDKFFSFIKDNMHYIYNMYTKEFIYYDLLNDPNEYQPQVSTDFEILYDECTNFDRMLNLNN
jgi:phosphoglycerol transferase MdoB-like AlkP superfamily enzyme